MRLSELQARADSMQQLLQIVSAMRSLASMRVQQAMHALDSVRQYGSEMAGATRAAMLLMGDQTIAAPSTAPKGRVVVIFLSEQGFVGAFNGRVLDVAEQELRPSDLLFVVGSRGTAIAEERAHVLRWTHPMATRPASIPALVRRILAELYPLIARGTVERAELVFARYQRGNPGGIARAPFFPLELQPPGTATQNLAPLHTLSPTTLIQKLTAEYLFALLTEAATESLASENAARLVAMDSARDNASKKLAELEQQVSEARQEEITTELLDLVTGEEALSGR